MADRRMMTKKVTEDDNFMALSSSAQALYLHLSMSADDDGFCNQVAVSMFRAHASVQDLQALLERRFVYQFESGVIVIRHWRMANALRKDRYTPTVFQEELAQLHLDGNGAYQDDVAARLPDGCQMVAKRLPQDRIGEDRIGEDRVVEGADEAVARVIRFYMDRINPMPSTVCTQQLIDYTNELSADVVIHGLEVALDEKKTSWSYIRAILQRYSVSHLATLDAVLADEEARQRSKGKTIVSGQTGRSFADLWREMKDDEG